jgi:hypothetical protein
MVQYSERGSFLVDGARDLQQRPGSFELHGMVVLVVVVADLSPYIRMRGHALFAVSPGGDGD